RGILAGHLAKLRGRQQANNWQSHRIHIAVSIASALQDTERLIELRRYFRAHAARNIRPDGSTFDFRLRDAIHYAVYTLQPQVETALLLEAAGLLAFDDRPDGTLARLRAGLDWLVPYAQGRRTHIEFETRKMPTDKKRAAAGVPGYSGKWDPAGARHLYWLAAYMDGTYLPIAKALASEPPQHLEACRGEATGLVAAKGAALPSR
ncbi:MAG: alginate lyase family protein, partial [Caldilineaceae bacterium]|nr:alginate lyase family protein [Caldilineaceae bacterium]